MTYAQAEIIRYLSQNPEIQALIKIQQEKLISEMEAQCNKGKRTSHAEFLHQSGKIEGHKAASFTEILEEAKMLIKKKNEEIRKNNES